MLFGRGVAWCVEPCGAASAALVLLHKGDLSRMPFCGHGSLVFERQRLKRPPIKCVRIRKVFFVSITAITAVTAVGGPPRPLLADRPSGVQKLPKTE